MDIKFYGWGKLAFVKAIIFYTGVILFVCQGCINETPKKIVYINSYHYGHPSSDEIMEGFMQHVPTDSFNIYSWYMDTKRNPSEEYIEKKARELLDSIRFVNPDILVVSDDNAVKYIVAPNLEVLTMPIVFCGVNWTDKDYHLPHDKVTGIIKILPIADAVQLLQSYYPSAKKLLVLNENTTTSRKEVEILDTLFQGLGLSATFKLVDNFQDWKTAFADGNTEFDMIYISTNAAIKSWNKDEAEEFICANIKVPVITCEDFMMPYAVLGVTKIAQEHGIWAAATAKRILLGFSVENISVTKNKLSNKWLNQTMAEKIRFKPDSTILRNMRIISE